MRRSLFSPLWYRVSGLRPLLHVDVRIERQRHRDQVWYQLIDDTSTRQFRVNPEAYAFIGRCDGTRTVQEVWDDLLDQVGDGAPTQDEVLQLLTQLSQRGLLESGANEARHKKASTKPRGALNPLAFRVPLGDPWPWLLRLDFLRALMFFRGSVWVWLAAVLGTAGAALLNWNELTADLSGSRWLWLSWLLFPFLKAVHELAHALAIRQFGGEVHKAGITLFLLTPAPYVDASAASALRARHQRAIVGAAGMMAELALAALAMLVWLNAMPGLARDLAFATMFSASVSCLLFNGNPLLRFDAYYVLCDVFELPQLAQRSAAWWGRCLRRLLRIGAGPNLLLPARGETKWLIAYAPLSLACRLLLGLGIVLWLGEMSFLLGAGAAAVILFGLLRPLLQALGALLREERGGREQLRVGATLAACFALVTGLLAAVPIPSQTSAVGVVWLPEAARVRPAASGFVAQLKAHDGARVSAGDVLLELSDPQLMAARERLSSRTAELNAEHFTAMAEMRMERAIEFEQELARTEAELRHVEERIAGLAVRSNLSGTLVLQRSADLPGTFAERGATMGYVLDGEQIIVRAAIEQQYAALVRDHTRKVEVRLADAPDAVLSAQRLREVPAATMELPSAALGDTAGGPHVTDPEDKHGLRLKQPVVLIDLALPSQQLERVGGRAWVRFDHGREPLAAQLLRSGRQLFLARFNPMQ
ncbi:MAG: PqqD family peptide modification chaperone [Burkholderiales bacterium]